MGGKAVFVYEGRDVDVAWDRQLCIHAGECTRAGGGVFDISEDPWCHPDRAAIDTVEEIVQRCPSGALTATRKDGSNKEVPEAENTIAVVADGPLHARGDLAVADSSADASADKPGVQYRAALCRCGLSGNKPFCDNSHIKGEFRDTGAIAAQSSETVAAGGPLSLKPLKDGPLLLKGAVTIIAADGSARWTGAKAALCRCGHSGSKPFCDGSHKDAGFVSG